MSEFEYVGAFDEELPFSHLTCSMCQFMAVQPVRLLHSISVDDCGTVTCLECYRRWMRTTKDAPHVTCPRCRNPCPHPTEEDAIPDRLLGPDYISVPWNILWLRRMVGHLNARCVFCNTIMKVEDMSSHGRACPPRRLLFLRQSHNPEGLTCGGQGECGFLRGCLWGEILGETLLPLMPTEVEQYVQEWMQSAIDGGDQYTNHKGFRRLAYYAPALVAGVWLRSWNSSTARAGPTVREMCAMFELLPAPHQGKMGNVLEERLQLAIGQDKDTTEYHRSLLDSAPKQGTMFVLSALSANLWRDLKRRVFHDQRPCSSGHLELLVYALEHSFMRPSAGWSPKMVNRLCQEPSLTIDTFARWIYQCFTSSAGMMLLGQSTLEWRNRCMAMQSFPLPNDNSPAATCYGVKHAVATLLALENPAELLNAFPVNGNMAPHIPHVINCFISAMLDYMQDVDVLEKMASMVVVGILRQQAELKLIMPPVIAIHIPVTGMMTEQILNLCVQSHPGYILVDPHSSF